MCFAFVPYKTQVTDLNITLLRPKLVLLVLKLFQSFYNSTNSLPAYIRGPNHILDESLNKFIFGMFESFLPCKLILHLLHSTLPIHIIVIWLSVFWWILHRNHHNSDLKFIGQSMEQSLLMTLHLLLCCGNIQEYIPCSVTDSSCATHIYLVVTLNLCRHSRKWALRKIVICHIAEHCLFDIRRVMSPQ